MYTRTKTISSSIEGANNYIEGYDVYNSKLIEQLRNPGLEREQYEINTSEYRPDLIAEDYYGSSSYESLVMIQTGTTLTNYTKGSVLSLIPKSELDSFLRSI